MQGQLADGGRSASTKLGAGGGGGGASPKLALPRLFSPKAKQPKLAVDSTAAANGAPPVAGTTSLRRKPLQKPKPAWRRPSTSTESARSVAAASASKDAAPPTETTMDDSSAAAPPLSAAPAAPAVTNGAARASASGSMPVPGAGLAAQAKAAAAAQAKAAAQETQRAALLSFMTAHGLKVSDVLRLCAGLIDDTDRV